MASPARRLHVVGDENVENVTAGKVAGKAVKPHGFPSGRSILKDLTPNTTISSRQSTHASANEADKAGANAHGSAKKGMSASPLKRGYRDVLGDDKGFRYLKRRRLSQSQPVSNTSLFLQDRTPAPSQAESRTQAHAPAHAQSQARPQSTAARRAPLSPPSSGRHVTGPSTSTSTSTSTQTQAQAQAHAVDDGAAPEKESDEDSGRESQNSNNTRGSFSSLINYDPSSQQALASQALHYVNIPPSVSAHTIHAPVSTRYSTSLTNTIRAHAEMLRLRLKVAIYKVRTNQINVPFSRLRAPESRRPAANDHGHPQTIDTFPSPALSMLDDLPSASRSRKTTSHDESLPYGLGLHQPPDPSMTPNVYSNRFMPLQRAPSSSPPPLIQMPPSSLPRNAMTRDAPMMGRISHDHDSLDSEATELAEDMHEGGDERSLHAESPSHAGHARRNNMSMFATALPR